MCQQMICNVVTDELPSQELGNHRDHAVYLTGEASPTSTSLTDFVAVLYYNVPENGRQHRDGGCRYHPRLAAYPSELPLTVGKTRTRMGSTAVSGTLCRISKTTGKRSCTSIWRTRI